MGLPRFFTAALCVVGLACARPDGARQVRITSLADYSFTITNVSQDNSMTRNACISSTAATGRYGIRATGSGTANTFVLAGTAAALVYDVQWSATPNQSSGIALVAGVTRSGLTTTALGLNLGCALGNDSAGLIIALRAGNLSMATPGAYTGVLTLLIASE